MSQKRRRRTAERHLTVIDRIALDMAEKTVTEAVQRREAIEDLNFRNLVKKGVIVRDQAENKSGMCDICKVRPIMHESWDIQSTKKTSLCCQCHMENGGIPADWHPICMKNTHRIIGVEQCQNRP